MPRSATIPLLQIVTELTPRCVYRWYRSPTAPVPRSEITRFPHAVLEVKLSLPEGENAPDWVAELIESGFLTEVRNWYSVCTILCTWREQLGSFSFPDLHWVYTQEF